MLYAAMVNASATKMSVCLKVVYKMDVRPFFVRVLCIGSLGLGMSVWQDGEMGEVGEVGEFLVGEGV
jgi:hypothetical protein